MAGMSGDPAGAGVGTGDVGPGAGLAIGRVVIFRSRTGKYDVPAIITCTAESLNPRGVAAFVDAGGWDRPGGAIGVPPLSSDAHVHLTVLTPGIPGQRATADDFLVRSDAPVQENAGGVYQEWDVPFASEPDTAGVGAGTWRWPERRS